MLSGCHCSTYSIWLLGQWQGELRNTTATRDAHKQALDLAQRGLADLEAALAREQTAAEESARKVPIIASLHCCDSGMHNILAPALSHLTLNPLP